MNWDGWETFESNTVHDCGIVESCIHYKRGQLRITKFFEANNNDVIYWQGEVHTGNGYYASCTSPTIEGVCDMLMSYVESEQIANSADIINSLYGIFKKHGATK